MRNFLYPRGRTHHPSSVTGGATPRLKVKKGRNGEIAGWDGDGDGDGMR